MLIGAPTKPTNISSPKAARAAPDGFGSGKKKTTRPMRLSEGTTESNGTRTRRRPIHRPQDASSRCRRYHQCTVKDHAKTGPRKRIDTILNGIDMDGSAA